MWRCFGTMRVRKAEIWISPSCVYLKQVFYKQNSEKQVILNISNQCTNQFIQIQTKERRHQLSRQFLCTKNSTSTEKQKGSLRLQRREKVIGKWWVRCKIKEWKKNQIRGKSHSKCSVSTWLIYYCKEFYFSWWVFSKSIHCLQNMERSNCAY